MNHLRKRTSKLATLDAARAVYFIIVGLAIKQSLSLFSHEWPISTIKDAPNWWSWSDRSLVGLGYLVTVLRFSHGVSQLYGYEKERIETSGLPSSSRVFGLSAFLASLGIIFFLMADNITQFSAYIGWTALMLSVDFMYIVSSHVIRSPISRLIRWIGILIINRIPRVKVTWTTTVPGYQAHAALQWMASDIILIVVCLLYIFVWTSSHELQFALILILVTVFDYYANRELYFGGREDKRRQKIVFVCSPLTGNLPQPTEQDLLENIRRAQMYCSRLMREGGKIPYASHCFYTYFLNDNDPRDRILGRYCALAFLSACDAIHVYLPYTKQPLGKLIKFIKITRLDFSQISSGMEQEILEASKLGLEIKYKRGIAQLPAEWAPVWRPLGYPEQEPIQQPALGGTENRKRVYVCTQLRGTGFSTLTSEQQTQRLQKNIKAALRYCHELVRSTAESVAPFAPQAFYPYFWNILGSADKWEAWFERSLEILKVCDALYVYTDDGLPNKKYISDGMLRVIKLAEVLGIEIQYRKSERIPENWNPAVPLFGTVEAIDSTNEPHIRAEELRTVPTGGIVTSA